MAGHVLSLQHSKESRDGDPTPVSRLLVRDVAGLQLMASQMDLDYIVRTDGYKIDRLAVVYRSVPAIAYCLTLLFNDPSSLPSALFVWRYGFYAKILR